ncbi:MAG: hypothetical protein ACK4NA_14665 [Alphaproteobacteria bacterium]
MPTVARLPADQIPLSPPNGSDAFLRQIERSIALLGGQHFLRISLFRLQFVGAADIGARARQALATLGMIGELPDGSLGLLFVGPRAAGQDDLAVERMVADKLNQALAQAAPSAARLLSLTAAHRFADEIGGVDDLIDEALFVAATRRSLARPAPLRKAS